MCPRVTVLMPVHNSEMYLSESIESILNQTYGDFEFIIINEDPGSITRAILDRYSKKDDRIKVYHQERQGLIASLNKGCELANGEYIARMDADDICLPERLERQLSFMDENPSVGVCGSWAEIIDSNGDLIGNFCPPTSTALIKWNLIFYCGIAHPSAIFRKESVKELGFYHKDCLHCEDYDLWVRAMNHFEFGNIPEFLLKLRKHNRNLTLVYYQEHGNNVLKVSQRAADHILKQEIPLEIIDILREPNHAKNAGDTREASTILYRLCKLFVNRNDIPEADRKQIKRATANRLYDLAINCFKMNKLYSIIIWSQSISLAPVFSLELMISTLKRIMPLRG
jgi:glycosyltransferase involved in cell wall biosynthesis